MTIWYVHRDDSGKITYAGVFQQGYSEEPLDDETNQEIKNWFAALNNVSTITNAQLKRQLNATGQLATAQQLVTAAGGLIMELWYGAATFHITDPELVALATTPAPNGLGMTPEQLQTFFNDAAKL
jgi:uncharacterized protein YgbK (DUF1537 family)